MTRAPKHAASSAPSTPTSAPPHRPTCTSTSQHARHDSPATPSVCPALPLQRCCGTRKHPLPHAPTLLHPQSTRRTGASSARLCPDRHGAWLSATHRNTAPGVWGIKRSSSRQRREGCLDPAVPAPAALDPPACQSIHTAEALSTSSAATMPGTHPGLNSHRLACWPATQAAPAQGPTILAAPSAPAASSMAAAQQLFNALPRQSASVRLPRRAHQASHVTHSGLNSQNPPCWPATRAAPAQVPSCLAILSPPCLLLGRNSSHTACQTATGAASVCLPLLLLHVVHKLVQQVGPRAVLVEVGEVRLDGLGDR